MLVSRTLAVVGGSAAGMSAASVAKRRDPELEVVVFERGGHISYSACGMPYRIAGEVQRPMASMVALTPDEAKEDKGVEARIRTEVTGIDHDERTLTWRDMEGGGTGSLDYDTLCLATGSAPTPAIPLDPDKGVFALHHLDDGITVDRWLEAHAPEHVAIVGGGFVGIEMAEACTMLDIQTCLVNKDRHVLKRLLDADMAEHVAERMEDKGITLVNGAYADGWSGKDRIEKVTAGDKTVEADMAIVATGTRPATKLAEAVGCRIGDEGGVIVDDGMRTGIEDVWACGDLVEIPHRITGTRTPIPLALHSNRSGRIAGENIAGADERFPGVIGTSVTRFHDLEIASTGLTEAQAQKHGFDVVCGSTKAATTAGYMPDPGTAHVKMMLERKTGRILGVQMVGGRGTALRIDAAAALIWQEATAETAEAVDFAYNPPFGPVWDPIAITARVAEKERRRAL